MTAHAPRILALVAGLLLTGAALLFSVAGNTEYAAAQPLTCAGYASQAAAQAAYRANPNLLDVLDRDDDGFACEANERPCDPVPVIRPGVRLTVPPDIMGDACREEIRAAVSRQPGATPTPAPTPAPTPQPAPSPAPPRTEAVSLVAGCNNVTLTWATGTPLNTVAADVIPLSALESVFRYDAAAARYFGYAPRAPEAVNDYRSVSARFEPVFVCVNAPATLFQPAP